MGTRKLALVSITTMAQPIGLIELASWVRSRAPDWSVEVIDANWQNPEAELMRQKWDAIGLSAMTIYYEKAHKLATRLKQRRVEAPILLGGVHISICPESNRPGFDVLIPGEGEHRLVSYLNTGDPRNEEKVALSDYPDIDLGLYSPQYWKPKLSRFWRGMATEATLITSRGCPFSCRFCSTTQFWKKYRTHSPEWIVRQIAALTEKGVDHVVIFDDLFTADKAHIKEVAERFERAGLDKVVKGVAVAGRADILDADICGYLKRMCVTSIGFGLESGSDRYLRYLKKARSSVAQNNRAIRLASAASLNPQGSVMLGGPGETLKEMLQTVGWVATAWRHGICDIIAFIATPYPGTEFWQIANAKGKVNHQMNFDELALREKRAGNALMLDIPRWQFCVVLVLLYIALLPYKIPKAYRIAAAWLSENGKPSRARTRDAANAVSRPRTNTGIDTPYRAGGSAMPPSAASKPSRKVG